MIPLRDTLSSHRTPVITRLLIALNVAVFLYQVSLDPWTRNHFIAAWGLVPRRLWVDPFTVLSSMFLHGGWFHLIGNMWFLWIFGDNVEDVLGRGRYLLFYLLCGVAAAAAQYMLNPYSRVPMVGASGAISGVMGAYLIKFPRARILTLLPIFIFFTTMEIPAVLFLVYWFVMQLFSGIGSIGYSHLSQGGVAFWAHVGGFGAGMALVKLLGTRPRYGARQEFHW